VSRQAGEGPAAPGVGEQQVDDREAVEAQRRPAAASGKAEVARDALESGNGRGAGGAVEGDLVQAGREDRVALEEGSEGRAGRGGERGGGARAGRAAGWSRRRSGVGRGRLAGDFFFAGRGTSRRRRWAGDDARPLEDAEEAG